MDLIQDLLCREIGKYVLSSVPNMEVNLSDTLSRNAVKTLQEIKTVLENDSLDDFMCVDEIVRIMESIGIRVESRHDFG